MIISSSYLKVAMNNLEDQISEQLKQCCKDEESFLKLKKLFSAYKHRQHSNEKQLELLEQAIQHDYDSIMITELNLEEPGPKIVYVNDGFTKMTGYTKEEVIGKTPRILQGPKTNPDVEKRLKERLQNGQSFYGYTVNYKKDGSEFINQWDIHPLTNEDGKVTNWVAYQRDVTERKKSSNAIFDANIDFEHLQREKNQIYIDLDVTGQIEDSNKAFKELTDYDMSELKGMRIWELVDDENKDEVQYLFSDFDQDSVEDKSYQWIFIGKSGEKTTLEGTIHSFNNNGETIVRIYFYNVTLRNKVIETLKQKKQQVEDILSKKEEFTMRFIRKADGEFVCKYISDSFENIIGYNPDLMLEKGIQTALKEEDIPEAEKALKEAFNGKPVTIRCKYKTSEGNELSALQSFKPDLNNKNSEVESVKSVVMIDL